MKYTLLIPFLLLGNCGTQPKEAVPQIILDTDIGGDIDDLGALYALHVYADKGLCDIVAVMSSWSMAFHINGIDAVNTYFGRPDIPIGAYEDDFFEKKEYTWFLGENFPSDLTGRAAPKATPLYRQLLAASADTSITVVVTGRLNNIYKLMQSPPDDISPLSGMELVGRKVKTFYIMGGSYSGEAKAEANFKNGGPGISKYVIDHCPRPIIFNGGEIGHASLGYATGKRMNDLPNDNILKAGYGYFFRNPPDWTGMEPSDRIQEWSIWDIITVQVAVTGVQDYFDIVETGYNDVDSTGANQWKPSPNKNQSYLVKKMNPQTYADSVIEKLLLIEVKSE